MVHDPLACACLNLRAASRRLSRRFDHILAPAGLLNSQFSLLTFVDRKPDCGVAELAAWLDMDVSTATRNLRPLRTEGYITVLPDSVDGRRRAVRLTTKGHRALKKALPLWEEAQSGVIGELGELRWEELLTLLKAIE